MEEAVIERRMHVPPLIVEYRVEGEGVVLPDGEVFRQLLPGEDLVRHVSALQIGHKGRVVAVGKTVGVYFINEKAFLAPGKQEKYRRYNRQRKKQNKDLLAARTHEALRKNILFIIHPQYHLMQLFLLLPHKRKNRLRSLENLLLTLSISCAILYKLKKYRGVEQLVARRAHNPEVVGSNPSPATLKIT